MSLLNIASGSQRISISVDETPFGEVACVQGDASLQHVGESRIFRPALPPEGGSESRFALTTHRDLTHFLNLLPHQTVNQSK